FGHVHFESWEKASQFYYSTMEKRFYYDDDKERGLIRFYSATYYNSTRKVVYKMDTEMANTGTLTSVSSKVEISDHNDINENTEMTNTGISTSVSSKVEISDHNDINENERSKKRKITEKRNLLNLLSVWHMVLHTPEIRNKADLLVFSVSDKLIIIEGNFSEKIVSEKSIKNFLPVGPFKVEVELQS
ncbi:9187_t:CDS:2, partial [Funneliformis geosporum]